MRPLHLFFAVAVLVSIGVTIWITSPVAPTVTEQRSRTDGEFFGKSREYDTSDGQEMKPLWND